MADLHTPLLLIDTSTQVCSVAIASSAGVISQRVSYEGNSHAANVGLFVSEVLTDTKREGILPAAVAISSGPGSYTGLRIGSSIAKGICFGMGIPLIAVPTLEVIAEAARSIAREDWLLCPMIDARRMEVYTAFFDSAGRALTDTVSAIIDADSFVEELKQHQILFVGNGTEKCRPFIKGANAHFVDEVIHPLAEYMFKPAFLRMQTSQYEDVAYWEPFYLKEFVATVAKNKVIH